MTYDTLLWIIGIVASMFFLFIGALVATAYYTSKEKED